MLYGIQEDQDFKKIRRDIAKKRLETTALNFNLIKAKKEKKRYVKIKIIIVSINLFLNNSMAKLEKQNARIKCNKLKIYPVKDQTITCQYYKYSNHFREIIKDTMTRKYLSSENEQNFTTYINIYKLIGLKIIPCSKRSVARVSLKYSHRISQNSELRIFL